MKFPSSSCRAPTFPRNSSAGFRMAVGVLNRPPSQTPLPAMLVSPGRVDLPGTTLTSMAIWSGLGQTVDTRETSTPGSNDHGTKTGPFVHHVQVSGDSTTVSIAACTERETLSYHLIIALYLRFDRCEGVVALVFLIGLVHLFVWNTTPVGREFDGDRLLNLRGYCSCGCGMRYAQESLDTDTVFCTAPTQPYSCCGRATERLSGAVGKPT